MLIVADFCSVETHVADFVSFSRVEYTGSRHYSTLLQSEL